MAYPTFSKSGVTTLTFEQGTVSPDVLDEQPRQVLNEATDGTLHVYTLSPARRIHTLILQDASATFLGALRTFLNDPLIDWSRYSFTYTDAESNTATVRYNGGPLRQPRTAVDTYDLTIVLREEVLP